MGALINRDKAFAEAWKQAIQSECQAAQQLIHERSGNDLHEVIHEVRKSFKKIRGMLRLVRDGIDYYKTENEFFRDEGRKISDIRDATSVIEALDLIYEQNEDFLYKNAFTSLRDNLLELRHQLVEDNQHHHILEEIGLELETTCEEVPKWPIDIDSFEIIESGINRVYTRGKKALERAQATRHPDDFHEWRKRVKYLRYQLRLLYPIWPDMLDTWEDEFHRLSDFLGTDRDLFMLSHYIESHEDLMQEAEREYFLNTLIEGHRKQMQEHALLLGEKIYVLSASKFTSLIKTAWNSHQRKLTGKLQPQDILES